MRRGEGNWHEAMENAVESVVNEINDIKRFQQYCERDKNIAMMMQMAEKQMMHSTSYTNLILVAGGSPHLGSERPLRSVASFLTDLYRLPMVNRFLIPL
ncbi:hypothetical protein SAMN04490203_1441 [Pseudomonas taetrolens]|uniref:Uncharacterized protein n=1 Tax=Pseudomonas taetrolens TaxID=47884 RepID=A0A1H4N9A8_PSETA|nr:hypothetical protein SAMN04490203_1441 [Pseudomonas taetrolens]SQF85608.1 Uncharacterised protein [Pseudomonas taetrolens]VEH48685.1 Uncharacterised protein [Pseudomonas taetrolens]